MSINLKGLYHFDVYFYYPFFLYNHRKITLKIYWLSRQLKNIFGIHEIIVAHKFEEKDINIIKENIIELLKEKDFKTFKVNVKRSDKNYPIDGMALRKVFGGHILKNIQNISVDVNNPDLVVNVEIRLKEVLIYFDSIKGIGGYPVGT